MEKAEKEIEVAVTKKTDYQNFRRKCTVKKTEPYSVPYHNTLCTVGECYSICHEECSLPMTYDKEDFRYCWAFRDSSIYCKECGHYYKDHHHSKIKFREIIQEKEYIDDLTLKKFQKAKTAEDKAKALKANVLSQRDASLKEKQELSKKLLSKIDEFQQLGINQNYIKLMENQLHIIEQRCEAETGPAATELHKTKEEIKKKIKLVKGQL